VSFDYLICSHSEPLNVEEMSPFALRQEGIPVSPGQLLPNGATILAEQVIRTFPFRRDSIVLAVSNSARPFASWIRTIHTDIPEKNDDGSRTSWYLIRDVCESGKYTSDLESAIADFNQRSQKFSERVVG